MLALGAKAAAHVGRYHADRIFGEIELFGHELADVVRYLAGRPDGDGMTVQPAGGRGLSDDRSRFHGGTDDSMVDDIDRYRVSGSGKRFVHRRPRAALELHAHIARRLGMQLYGARCCSVANIGDRLERFPVDGDLLSGV